MFTYCIFCEKNGNFEMYMVFNVLLNNELELDDLERLSTALNCAKKSDQLMCDDVFHLHIHFCLHSLWALQCFHQLNWSLGLKYSVSSLRTIEPVEVEFLQKIDLFYTFAVILLDRIYKQITSTGW